MLGRPSSSSHASVKNGVGPVAVKRDGVVSALKRVKHRSSQAESTIEPSFRAETCSSAGAYKLW